MRSRPPQQSWGRVARLPSRGVDGGGAAWRRWFLLGAVAIAAPLGLAGCMPGGPTYSEARPPSILVPGGPGAGLPLGAGGLPPPGTPVPPGTRPIAILAPLTGPNAERGTALVNAAELALADPGAPKLDVHDTAGTPEGAAAAARAAIAAGDGVILGPLTAPETASVAAVARVAAVPVLAFTTDPAEQQPGVWTLGITPGQQVRRLVAAMTAQGKTRFAAVLPDTEFGRAMATALTQATQQQGAGVPTIRMHGSDNASIEQAMRDVSGYADRRGGIEARIRAARDQHSPAGDQLAADLARTPVPPAPFDALLLADTGPALAYLSSFIAFDDIGPPAVRVLGPALWVVPALHAGASLDGAWFAAPDASAPSRLAFNDAYMAKFGVAAPGISDVAFDAATIAKDVASTGGYAPAALTNAGGFPGVDGPVALMPDGQVRRGLALFEVRGGGGQVIEPAPATVPPAAS